MRKTLFVFVVSVCFILLAGCSPQDEAAVEPDSQSTAAAPESQEAAPTVEVVENPDAIDESFLTGEPCEAPCWYNIEIGETLASEATFTLNYLPFVERSSVQIIPDLYDPQAQTITYDCHYETIENCGIIGVSALGVVTGIAHQVAYSLSVADVVEKYAEPAYMYTNAYYGENDDCQLALYWPADSLAVEVVEENASGLCQDLEDGGAVPPDLQVLWIYYTPLSESAAEGTLVWPGFAE